MASVPKRQRELTSSEIIASAHKRRYLTSQSAQNTIAAGAQTAVHRPPKSYADAVASAAPVPKTAPRPATLVDITKKKLTAYDRAVYGTLGLL
jgi:hypothetical protein